MKTIWKGSISFGLVSIPIQLYSAIQKHVVGFKLLHAKCNTPIQYERWCPSCKTEVVWTDIVKGLKLKNDTYFIITEEKLKQLKPEKTDTIDIVEFVDTTAIAPIYFDQHYYVVPTKETEKAYFLFQRALQQLQKTAIGRFVMRDKEYVTAIQAYEQGLLLTTLNYAYEIRPVKAYDALKSTQLKQPELALAKQLITQLSKKEFDISDFKDTFIEKLQKKIKESIAGKKVKKIKTAKPKKVSTADKTSLMDALRASLEKRSPTTERRSA